jgi:hypothetical protein
LSNEEVSVLAWLAISAALQGATALGDMDAAVLAERQAAPACLQELKSSASGGQACALYFQQVRNLRAAGGEAQLRQGDWAEIVRLTRQRETFGHSRAYGAAIAVSTASARP